MCDIWETIRRCHISSNNGDQRWSFRVGIVDVNKIWPAIFPLHLMIFQNMDSIVRHIVFLSGTQFCRLLDLSIRKLFDRRNCWNSFWFILTHIFFAKTYMVLMVIYNQLNSLPSMVLKMPFSDSGIGNHSLTFLWSYEKGKILPRQLKAMWGRSLPVPTPPRSYTPMEINNFNPFLKS